MSKSLLYPLFLLLILQLLGGILMLTFFELRDIEQRLDYKISRVQSDIEYKNGQWNIERYNSDPELVGYYPLYIFTKDGFVLDRRYPIKGFLDSSDFTRLLEYETPETYISRTQNTRRIYSLALKNKSGTILGVLTVSYFNPKEAVLDDIDRDLVDASKTLRSKIRIIGDTIDVSQVDEGDIAYDITYLIVDKYNSILKKSINFNNIKRIPSVIDPSHVTSTLSSQGIKFVRDDTTKQYFMVDIRPLVKNGKTEAVVITGESLEGLIGNIRKFLLSYGLLSVGLFILFYLFLVKIYSQRINNVSSLGEVSSISFSAKESILYIDETKIEITYATNQYFLLKKLFSDPKRRYETDEILDAFGEISEEVDSRKVYDTMSNINKKVAGYLRLRLIINQNKTYKLNPNLPVIRSSK